MNVSQLVTFLNAITVGEVDSIRAKLDEARQACLDVQQEELADKLREAKEALQRADLTTFRKRVETVVAQLGHAR